jgi:hypothetical protein
LKILSDGHPRLETLLSFPQPRELHALRGGLGNQTFLGAVELEIFQTSQTNWIGSVVDWACTMQNSASMIFFLGNGPLLWHIGGTRYQSLDHG